jgi:hypothetical protein
VLDVPVFILRRVQFGMYANWPDIFWNDSEIIFMPVVYTRLSVLRVVHFQTNDVSYTYT